MSNTKILLYGFVLIMIIRLLITQMMGLTPQDAYYYFYSEHLALSYFDHPPMVAYMLKIFTSVLGKSAVAIKTTNFLVSIASLFSFYSLCTFFLPKQKAINATLLYGTTFMVTLLAINTTPDVPMILFWTLTLIALYKAVFEEVFYCWILSGILMGCAFDSKYTALILLFGLIAFLILSTKYRRYLFSKEMLLLVIFFVVTISPIFIWNIENDWISFKFQSADRASSISGFRINPRYFFGNLGSQILLLFPFVFGAIFYMFYKLAKTTYFEKQLPEDKTLFLLCFSIPIMAFFFPLSLIYWVKLNWIMPGYIAALILFGQRMKGRIIPYHIATAVLIHIAALVQIVYYPILIKSDDTWMGWEELSDEITVLKKSYPDHFVFSNDGYKTSAALSFYQDEEIYAGNVIGAKGLQFSIVQPNLDHLKSKDALFIDSDRKFRHEEKLNVYPEILDSYFDTIIELSPILVHKEGRLVRKFQLFDCKNYSLSEKKK